MNKEVFIPLVLSGQIISAIELNAGIKSIGVAARVQSDTSKTIGQMTLVSKQEK
ncbi:hypothetical protein C942_04942 [Photobacterium marinum]|uniref:Uncharacterized protein n=1 Tax=Photobacterium marinum TaxID=1056511 RepID=L8JBT5_9GAMM|nr:hypothetical protein [Photobacterium marinum]ELR66280.1 hypothetical protein C942_04942 [Photobacterium marinum]